MIKVLFIIVNLNLVEGFFGMVVGEVFIEVYKNEYL